jgi:cysteinyl-tRNA synthetase
MAMHHLGETLDIHCGGSDHIRVHHTMKLRKANVLQETFCSFWMHGEFLRMVQIK